MLRSRADWLMPLWKWEEAACWTNTLCEFQYISNSALKAIWKKKCPWDQGLQRDKGRSGALVDARLRHRQKCMECEWSPQSLQQELRRWRGFKVRKGGSSTFIHHHHRLLRTYSSHNASLSCPFLSFPSFPLLLGCCIKSNIAVPFTTGNATTNNLNGH